MNDKEPEGLFINNMEKREFRPGVSCCGAQDLREEDFENYAKAGIMTMELSFSWDRYDSIPWKEAYHRAAKNNVELWSFHLPFMPFNVLDIASLDEDKRRKTISYQSELIKKAGNIGISAIVIHPSIEPNRETEREEKIKRAQESLIYLADIAEEYGMTIAVENLPRTCLGRDSSDMLKLICADERLRICFDTNHLLSQPIKEFIRAVGSKIITTHVSDFDFKNERHWMPGEGKINWPEIIDTLQEVNYSGPLMYELELTAPPTINRRVLTYDDFKQNHESLMRGEIPEAIGTPIAEKCIPWQET